MTYDMLSGLDMYCTDPAQHLETAGLDDDELDHDMSDLSEGAPSVPPLPLCSSTAQTR